MPKNKKVLKKELRTWNLKWQRKFWSKAIMISLFLLLIFTFAFGDIRTYDQKFIRLISHQEPPGGTYLPPNAIISYEETEKYKMDQLITFRRSLQNTILVIFASIGIDLSGFSATGATPEGLQNNIANKSAEKPIEDNKEEGSMPGGEELTTWQIIKLNTKVAFSALHYMLAVRIVIIDNKPVKILGKNLEFIDKNNDILRWAESIIEVAEKYNLDPALIAAVMEQESGGNATVTSPAGAIGLMQLMPGTAKGLGINPYDPKQNLEGGAKYLSIQLKRYGSLNLALAAYNAGPGNVSNGRYLYLTETQNYMRNVPVLMDKYDRIFNQPVSTRQK